MSPPYKHICTTACPLEVGSLPLRPPDFGRGFSSYISSRPPYIVAIRLPKSSPRPALARRLIGPFEILSVRVPTAHSASNYSLTTSVLTPYPWASRHTVYPIPSHIVLKLFPFPALEFMEFFEVGKTLCRCLKAGLLTIYSLTKELFCTNLLRSFSGFSMSMVKCEDEERLPGALFLTLGGPREASILVQGTESQQQIILSWVLLTT